MSHHDVSVLFVCLGNICRSPTAEAVFQQRVREAGLEHDIRIDSAGTAAYHVAQPPDSRAQAAGQSRGYNLAPLRARQVTRDDFMAFDHVIAMDKQNLVDLERLWQSAGEQGARPVRFLDYAQDIGEVDVPDPYYGGGDGFDHVLDLCEAAADGLLARIRQDHFQHRDDTE